MCVFFNTPFLSVNGSIKFQFIIVAPIKSQPANKRIKFEAKANQNYQVYKVSISFCKFPFYKVLYSRPTNPYKFTIFKGGQMSSPSRIIIRGKKRNEPYNIDNAGCKAKVGTQRSNNLLQNVSF